MEHLDTGKELSSSASVAACSAERGPTLEDGTSEAQVELNCEKFKSHWSHGKCANLVWKDFIL